MKFSHWYWVLFAFPWIGFGNLGLAGETNATSSAPVTLTNAPVTSTRTYLDMGADWRFSRGDFANAMMPEFDDHGWQRVNVPHDWSSEGPFSADYGSGNGYAPGGIGWYRKQFHLDAADRDRLVAIEFDGIYDYAEVWVNGNFVGDRPYGYSSFECLLTPLLKFGDGENVIAVRVDHSRYADSRWYTGSGIYRHVRLRLTDRLHVGHWGIQITTPDVTSETATVRIETTIENASGQRRSFSLQSEIIAPDGRMVGNLTTPGRLSDGTN